MVTELQKLRGYRNFGKKNKVDFLIIGAQKCGTTALFEFLNEHPMIVGAVRKEINFFNYDCFYDKGINYYHGYFPSKKKNQLYFEASPSYLQDNNYISCIRIYNYYPKIKMIILLRNPVERAFSAFKMYQKKWHHDPTWFDLWKKKDVNYIRRNAEDYSNFRVFIEHEINALRENKLIEAPIINHGKYVNAIKKYYEKFSPDQFYIADNNNLIVQTHNELNKILFFLGIREEYNWNFPKGKIIFSGEYKDKIDIDSKKILEKIYEPYNNELFETINKTFAW